MAFQNRPDAADKPQRGRKQNPQSQTPPGWASGLRQLYDGVVEEPLPDSFRNLLSKMDEDDNDCDTKNS